MKECDGCKWVDRNFIADIPCRSCHDGINYEQCEPPVEVLSGDVTDIRVLTYAASPEEISSHNNGGATDYYDLPEGVKQCQDIIEWRNMNYSQGNIFKASFCFNTERHGGTNYERELNKIIFFANKELKKLKKD